MRILVANEPRSYRETFAVAFRTLRPHIEMTAVEPDALEREALRVRPDLVICSRVTDRVRSAARFWVKLRVENETLVAFTNVCALRTNTNIELDELLSIIDRAEELIHADDVERGCIDSRG